MSTSSEWTPRLGHIGNDPPNWPAKRPLRIAILGDFGGGALSGRLETGADLARRKPLKVEFDTLEDALGRLDLKLTLPLGAEGAPVEVPIADLDAFHPDQLYDNLEVFSSLASLRQRLNNTSTFAKAAAEVQAMAGSTRRRASTVSTRSRARGLAPSAGARLDDFARLVGRPAVAAGTDDAIGGLLRNIIGPFVVPAASPNKAAMLETVDAALSDAMRAVLHQPDFQNAESLWRGVDFLLRRLETSHQLQVHLIDVSAEELAADLSAVEDLSESGLYKLLVEKPSQDADGGYTYLAGCYRFEATPPHAELLARAALVAAHAGAPFITEMATDAFTDRKEPPHRLVSLAFETLRTLPYASFLALVGPRFLLRHPYGERSDPVSRFDFEEFSRDAGLRGMLWGHPSLLALCVLGIRGGQLTIGDLPFHHFVDDDGDSTALPCTDRLINTQAAAMLRDVGINGVMAHKGEALVRLAGLQAVNGDGLAAAKPGAAKAAVGGARVSLQAKIDTKKGGAEVAYVPAARTGGVAPTAAPGQPAAAPAPAAAEEDAPAAAAAAPEEAPAAEEAAVDDELAALLASLEADTPAAEPAADAGGDAAAEEEMDPELAELLKSLG